MKRLGVSFTKSTITSPVDPHRHIHAVVIECEKDDKPLMLAYVVEALDLLDEKRKSENN